MVYSKNMSSVLKLMTAPASQFNPGLGIHWLGFADLTWLESSQGKPRDPWLDLALIQPIENK